MKTFPITGGQVTFSDDLRALDFHIELGPLPSVPAAVTDATGVYPPPSPPALPQAGGKFFDPTFGTEIMRVTDEHTANGSNGDSGYSYYGTFNKDSTRLIARMQSIQEARFFQFDPVGFTLGAMTTPGISPDGGQPDWGECHWSGIYPNRMICHNSEGHRIFYYDVTTNSYSLIADLSSLLGKNEYIYQMTRSLDDKRFAFTIKLTTDYSIVGFAVYDLTSNSIILRVNTTDLDEVHIDKTGRYLVWMTEEPAGDIKSNIFRIFDLATKTSIPLSVGSPDYAMNHYGVGAASLISGYDGYDIANLYVESRSLANPHNPVPVFQFDRGFYNIPGGSTIHVSILGDDESWVTCETYSGSGGVWYPLRDEILLIENKAQGRVRRLAHHQSVTKEYYDQPRANISRDGRFIAFTSNWGASGRRDLFVARVM